MAMFGKSAKRNEHSTLSDSEMQHIPRVYTTPDALMGHIVQIALSEHELGGPMRLIPPLKVLRHAYSRDHYAAVEEINPWTYFVGRPLREFLKIEDFARDLSYVTSDMVFIFYTNIQQFEPYFCLDQAFLDFLEKNKMRIPVWVHGAEIAENRFTDEFIAYRDNYGYLGSGELQLFVPRKGFVSPWPDRWPYGSQLKRIEQLLLSMY